MDAFGDYEPDWAIDPFGDPSDDNADADTNDEGGGTNEGKHFGAEHILFLLDCDDSMFDQYVPCLPDVQDGDDIIDDNNNEVEEKLVSPMEVAITAAHKFLRTKIRDIAETRTGRRDAVGLLLYGCDPQRGRRKKSNNNDDDASPKSNSSGSDSEQEDLPTTEELIELSPPGIEQVMKVGECMSRPDNPNVKQRNLRREYAYVTKKEINNAGGEDGEEEEEGYDSATCLHQGLAMASKIFGNSKHVKTPSASSKQLPDSRTIWIFTNNDDPCKDNEETKNRLRTAKNDCQEGGITINVLPLPKLLISDEEDSSGFDKSIFYNDLTSTSSQKKTSAEEVKENDFNVDVSYADVGTADGGPAVDIDTIVDNFQMGMKKRRKYATLPLLLPGWKGREDNPGIMLDLYSAVQVRSKPAKVAVHQEKNKATFRKTKRYNEETAEYVENEDVHNFVDFCGRVPIQPADLSMVKQVSNSQDEASLAIHGFRPMKLLPRTNLLTRSVFVLANDLRVNGSGKALYNLKQSMRKKKVFAVGELLLRAAATSKMVAFVPKDDSYGGLYIIQLPYKEDVRTCPQSQLGFADRASVDSAKKLIAKSTLHFDDAFQEMLPENPFLKHFFGFLESVSLGKPLQKVEDDAKMDTERLLEMAREEIESFSLSLPEDDLPIRKDRKRKAQSGVSKPEFVKESISDEWITLYKNDEVDTCTATELKAFLKSQGERVAGKKSDLVDRIHRVLQKHLFNE